MLPEAAVSLRDAVSLVCADVTFAWPDGTVVMEGLSWTAGPRHTGLVGVNGSGKSTLLRLVAGRLIPADGIVRTSGRIGYLPQDVTVPAVPRVDSLLGIARKRDAVRAVESGDIRDEHFAEIGDDWDVEERALAAMAQLGLGHIALDRAVGDISGGEMVLLRLAAVLLDRPDVLLLDEPTNNLDSRARQYLYEALARHKGIVITVSHDRELLAQVDSIAELSNGGIRAFGGNLSEYEAIIASEQEAAARLVRTAKGEVARERRVLAEAQTRQARSNRYGKKQSAENRLDKGTTQYKKRAAQESAGKRDGVHEQRLTSAQERLDRAKDQLRDDDTMRTDFPDTIVPPGRAVLSLSGVCLRNDVRVGDVRVHGPERIAITGHNGAGKSTLLRTLAGELPPVHGQVEVHVPLRYLPQRLALLDEEDSIVGNIARFAPGASDNRIRAQLARFLFKGRAPDQRVATLSGGERFRATLAALLMAEPPPQLLMLDEPTNNLDLASIAELTHALSEYPGTLVVASHDPHFLRGIGITQWWQAEGGRIQSGDPAML
ncbi:ABC-F family ATP-binding cassette domain-containing protein [Streptomyces sp. NPDC050256]|uniref:ABC-F family ATP-binding cassette domain-containing protein n=1 Tax=unclassified Streptomyces TaxID=2593676 RepID=UPI00378A3D2B